VDSSESGSEPAEAAEVAEGYEDSPIDDRALSAFEAKEGDFVRIDRLGVGMFGQVCSARDIRTGAVVALKTYHRQWLEGRALEFFNREVRALASARHPALLRLCSYVPANNPRDEYPAIATELAPYGSLENFIQGRQVRPEWDLTQKYIVVYGTAVGMMVLHRRLIIHRDLKPDNIFIDEHFEPKVGDFGTSKDVDPNASKNQSCEMGTPLYQAPEILDGEAYGRQVDVYAFGITFNATMADEGPYESMGYRNPMFLVTKVIDGVRPSLATGIPASWTRLIEQCWDRNPDVRPSFQAIVAEMSKPEFLGPDIDVARFLQYQKKVVPQALWC
jgi:serine/threonine protein kinase